MNWKTLYKEFNEALSAGNHIKVRRMYKTLIGEIVNRDETLMVESKTIGCMSDGRRVATTKAVEKALRKALAVRTKRRREKK